MAQWRRRDVVGTVAAVAVIAGPAARAIALQRDIKERGMAELMDWEDFVDQLRPLGARLMERIPPHMRDDPQTVQESYRLLLSGLMRGITGATRCSCPNSISFRTSSSRTPTPSIKPR
jgi:hypothetical protein